MIAERKRLLEELERSVVERFRKKDAAHDHHHILRVRDNSLKIQEGEREGDPFLIQVAALLHDVGDPKFFEGDVEQGKLHLREWMSAFELEEKERDQLERIIQCVSFKGKGVRDDAVGTEGMIVQDADRLDAIGAIGIARAFAFGGSKERPIHTPENGPEIHTDQEAYLASQSPTIAHFYEKLLLLKDRMKTSTGKRIATERHRFMEEFLHRFFQEWEGRA
ncbi:MAG: HD domain-containing protein [Flavobacteriales bacterium]